MAGGLGFFLGGLSDSLNQGFQRQQTADFQQQELKLQQQGQENAQKRFDMARNDKLAEELWNSIQATVDNARSVGHNEKEITPAIQGLVDQYRKFTTTIGYPGMADQKLAALWASPPSTEVEAAHAKAKDPLKIALEESQIERNRATSDPFGLRGRGNAFQPGETITGVDVQEVPPGQPLTKTAQATPSVTGSGQGAGGDAFLATLPPQLAQAVKAVGDYEMDPTSLLSRGNIEARTQFLGLVKQYNPDFDIKEFKGRNAAVLDFSKGPTAKSIQSFNVLVDHLDVLKQSATALGNKDIPAFNALKNAIETATGQPAPNTFDGVKKIVMDELTKAIIGGAGALGDREAIEKTVNAANSPAQLADLITKYQRLAAGQLSGFDKRYQATTGRKDFQRFLSPRTQTLFGQHQSQDEGSAKPSQPKIPPPPPGYIGQ